jgi:hypothetical protein
VTLGLVYVPAVAPLVARSIPITPEDIIGELVTTSLLVDTGKRPTLVTVPPPPPLPPVDEMVTAPFELLIVIFVPATMLVTPVLVRVTVPVVAFEDAEIPVPPTKLT